MIDNNIKPVERFVKFIVAAEVDAFPNLKVEIKIYDEPVGTADVASIFSTIEILEEDGSRYGILCYEAILTEKEVEEAFRNILADPTKFKN